MSTTTEPTTLPPITCQSWCEDGDGHPHEVFRMDQWCRSEEAATLLVRDYRHRDGTIEVDTVAVSTVLFPGRTAEVAIRHTAPDDEAFMSPAEARAIAAALIAAADVAEVGA